MLLTLLFLLSMMPLFGQTPNELFSLFTSPTKAESTSRLIKAIQDCNVATVHALVKLGEPLNLLDADGFAPLHYAVFQDDPYLVRMLIFYGALPDRKTEHDFLTPLHVATILGFETVMEALIDVGAQVNLVDAEKRTPLHYAALYNYSDEVLLLLEMGANALLQDIDGCTAFDFAYEHDNCKVMDELIQATDPDGITLLHQAATQRDIDLVRELLASGAHPLVFDYSGHTPLDYARRQRYRKIVSLLVNTCDNTGSTLLHFAAKNGDVSEVRRLIDEGADVHSADDNGTTPLLHAAKFNQLHVLQVLMMHGADPFVQDKEGNGMLHLAAQSGSIDIINWYMIHPEFGVDPRNKAGQTPLQLAAQNGQFSSVNLLLGFKAYPYSTDFNGNSVLSFAAQSNNPKVLTPLLRNKPLMNRANVKGESPLHYAAMNENPDIIANFLPYKPQVDIINPQGQTPLHIAAHKGNEEQAVSLLDHGAAVNRCDFKRNRPLHYAAMGGHVGLIKPLLNCKANRSSRNCESQTPRDVALNNGHCNFADALEHPELLPDFHICPSGRACGGY